MFSREWSYFTERETAIDCHSQKTPGMASRGIALATLDHLSIS
jgi:hypothetical protein